MMETTGRERLQMMHVYYCIYCKKYHYTNNQARAICCNQPMYLVDVDFTDFVSMSREDREHFLQIYALAETTPDKTE